MINTDNKTHIENEMPESYSKDYKVETVVLGNKSKNNLLAGKTLNQTQKDWIN